MDKWSVLAISAGKFLWRIVVYILNARWNVNLTFKLTRRPLLGGRVERRVRGEL